MPAEIRNADRLLRKLTIIPEYMRQQVREAMADEADEIVALMKSLAPTHIAPSIGWRWGAKAPKGTRAVAHLESGSSLTITIYASEWTAAWFEFGTADRYQKTKGYKFVGAITKQPFFFVSYRAKRKEARRAIRAAVKAAAKQVATAA